MGAGLGTTTDGSVDAPDGTTDRRERRRQRTREDIAREALRLAVERGYDNVTVEEIAEAADIAPRTFFRYFPRKDDLLFVDHDGQLERLREALADRPDDEPVLVSIREAVLEVVEEAEIDPDRTRLKRQLIEQTPSLKAQASLRQRDWYDVLAGAVGRHLAVDPDEDLRPRVIAAAIVGALQISIDRWSQLPDGDLRAKVTDAIDLLDGISGLRTG
ncbi:acyl-CoA-like ligand-binding transcription factor [Dermatobacter hominis]|uniref:acyl-CoA-like ligand-binding transcription factor n=1 Tax=Dermatobacter hominis TaxID=2884263 RepID=UPI001D115B34|nr:TetR family transcriptional regulator [Dermatobacter hominis]UDY35879.1 TetR family transcriptional regulator [Dermatobacter hominis]